MGGGGGTNVGYSLSPPPPQSFSACYGPEFSIIVGVTKITNRLVMSQNVLWLIIFFKKKLLAFYKKVEPVTQSPS